MKASGIRTELIAPCGMNCRLCRAHIRDRKACPGCRGDDSSKTKTRIWCRIRNCQELLRAEVKYCSACESLPCARLNHLDKRYRSKYGMSMIENLKSIKKLGIRRFISNERERWTCPECGELICVHEPRCLCCQHRWRQNA